ncbi:MAG TPA: hypothetical protein VFD36_26315 [Kofleriaceae bacterium]|nr:hypothetical protein [Kofleriaceae bacterium]
MSVERELLRTRVELDLDANRLACMRGRIDRVLGTEADTTDAEVEDPASKQSGTVMDADGTLRTHPHRSPPLARRIRPVHVDLPSGAASIALRRLAGSLRAYATLSTPATSIDARRALPVGAPTIGHAVANFSPDHPHVGFAAAGEPNYRRCFERLRS